MRPRRLIMVLACATIVLAGCKRNNEVTSYDAPKEPTPGATAAKVETPTMQSSGPTATADAPSAPPIDWTLPAGWTAQPGTSMRYATLIVPTGDSQPLEVRVTPLAAMAGDVPANVNRWAGQIGLPEIPADHMDQIAKPMTIGGQAGHLVKLVNPSDGREILAAIAPAGEHVWFLMMMDAQKRIGPHEEQFTAWLESIRFPQEGAPAEAPAPQSPPMAAGQIASGAMPSAGAAIDYQKPAAWHDDPAPSSMRAASFILGDSGDKGEVSVTHFPGDVGGLLANINRWRGQVGLPPITDPTQQPFTNVTVDGHQGLGFDITADAPRDELNEAKRMIVFFIPVNNETWFFKMDGPHALLEKNRDAFSAFCQSVKFKGASGG